MTWEMRDLNTQIHAIKQVILQASEIRNVIRKHMINCRMDCNCYIRSLKNKRVNGWMISERQRNQSPAHHYGVNGVINTFQLWWEAGKWSGYTAISTPFITKYSFRDRQVWQKPFPVHLSSVTQSCPTICNTMDCSTPGFPVRHQLPELAQTHVRWVGDAIQAFHPLSSLSPPTFNLSQHQRLFQWVSSSHQVAKVLAFQLQHQSFQWIFRTDVL